VGQVVREARLLVAAALVVLVCASGCASHPAQQAAVRPPASAAPAGPGTRTTSPAPVTSATPVTSPTPAAVTAGRDGSYRTGERQVTFTEPAHAGPDGQGLGRRALVTQVWYPRGSGATGPFPLLLFAPGFLQCSGAYSQLLQAWASAGYVVAAVNFPRTNCHLGEEADEADLVNQPRDMSYVLTSLLTLSARPGDPFSGLLDPAEVGAAGQSDGGDTVAALVANACCTDHRFEAVAVLSGAEWPPMPGRYFPGGVPPMLFTQGSADPVNPPWASLQLYRADDTGPRYYLDLFGASHLVPYEGTSPVESLVARVTLAFFDRYVLGQAGALGAMTRTGNVAGTAALVGGGRPPP
jgi:dienelactone hydrolase